MSNELAGMLRRLPAGLDGAAISPLLGPWLEELRKAARRASSREEFPNDP